MVNQEHPSYGMLSFSRSNVSGAGSGVSLFGSSIKHNNTIRLTISKGTVNRRDGYDSYYYGIRKDAQYIEVEMSYSQFAEAITSLNMGNGVPVTVRYLNGQRIEPCPFQDKQAQFRQEFEEMAKSAAASLADLAKTTQAIFDSKRTLTKADKDEILSTLNGIAVDIAANMPFMYEMFQEQMQKTVTEAKGEIESFMQNRLNSIALAAIAENNAQLLSEANNAEIPPISTDDMNTVQSEDEEQVGMSMGGVSM